MSCVIVTYAKLDERCRVASCMRLMKHLPAGMMQVAEDNLPITDLNLDRVVRCNFNSLKTYFFAVVTGGEAFTRAVEL